MPVKPTSLPQFFNYCLQNQLPLAFYRLPGTNNIKVVAQNNPVINKTRLSQKLVSQQGFLFAPFVQSSEFPCVLIKPDIFCTAQNLPALTFAKGGTEQTFIKPKKARAAGKVAFKQLVKAITTKINEGHFKKIVAARTHLHAIPTNFNPAAYYQKLCKKYPNAFVSLVQIPGTGLWIGASPEILLQADSAGFKTYSLAGTRANTTTNNNLAWGEKEKGEQKFVSDYVAYTIQKVTGKQPQIIGPETVSAANLQHLRTTFISAKPPHNLWPTMVAALHPTPAVAGLPKKKAIAFIQQHETEARRYYSGYLGPVNLDGQINLFVNLRCMQVLQKQLAVYVGCGITANSNPDAEWVESEIKTHTLLSVL